MFLIGRKENCIFIEPTGLKLLKFIGEQELCLLLPLLPSRFDIEDAFSKIGRVRDVWVARKVGGGGSHVQDDIIVLSRSPLASPSSRWRTGGTRRTPWRTWTAPGCAGTGLRWAVLSKKTKSHFLIRRICTVSHRVRTTNRAMAMATCRSLISLGFTWASCQESFKIYTGRARSLSNILWALPKTLLHLSNTICHFSKKIWHHPTPFWHNLTLSWHNWTHSWHLMTAAWYYLTPSWHHPTTSWLNWTTSLHNLTPTSYHLTRFWHLPDIIRHHSWHRPTPSWHQSQWTAFQCC